MGPGQEGIVKEVERGILTDTYSPLEEFGFSSEGHQILSVTQTKDRWGQSSLLPWLACRGGLWAGQGNQG